MYWGKQLMCVSQARVMYISLSRGLGSWRNSCICLRYDSRKTGSHASVDLSIIASVQLRTPDKSSLALSYRRQQERRACQRLPDTADIPRCQLDLWPRSNGVMWDTNSLRWPRSHPQMSGTICEWHGRPGHSHGPVAVAAGPTISAYVPGRCWWCGGSVGAAAADSVIMW